MSYEAGAIGGQKPPRPLVRLRRTWLFVLSCLWMVGGLIPVLAAVLGAGTKLMPMWASVLIILGYMGGVGGSMRAWQKWWAVRRGALRATEDGLWVNGRLLVKRKAISRAYHLEVGGRSVVRMVQRGTVIRSLDVEVENADEAKKLLAAMRLDAAGSVTEWRLQSGTKRTGRIRLGAALMSFLGAIGVVVFLLLGVDAGHTTVIPRVIALVLYLLATLGLGFGIEAQMVDVAVGADGLRLRQLARKRFIPYGDIERVTIEGGDIRLHLKGGSTVDIHHPDEGKPNLLTDREHDAKKLAERIEEQLAAHRAAPKANVDVLTRAGRRAEQWLHDARALTERNATFRTPAVPNEELWRIVEDAAADPSARAGAAVALQRELDDSARARLRVAAAACAAPQLRVALECVADEDDEADLLRALDPLEDLRARRL